MTVLDAKNHRAKVFAASALPPPPPEVALAFALASAPLVTLAGIIMLWSDILVKLPCEGAAIGEVVIDALAVMLRTG